MNSETIITIGRVQFPAILSVPIGSTGLVLFVHGSEDNSFCRQSVFIAHMLNMAGLSTILIDLLADKKDQAQRMRFSNESMTDRLVGITKWCMSNSSFRLMNVGYLGSGTGAAAALSAAAYYGTKIRAVVCRGGLPDLTAGDLDLVEAATLLIVGGEDRKGMDLNRQAYTHMGCEKKMETIPGATHLFEEPGALERVAELVVRWFASHLI